jgi:hypothetical protein
MPSPNPIPRVDRLRLKKPDLRMDDDERNIQAYLDGSPRSFGRDVSWHWSRWGDDLEEEKNQA